MHPIDWTVMLGTLFGIVAFGVYKTRNIASVQSYLLGDRDLKWWTIGLSVMATQASAITFLSTPGQAYDSGMGFAQFYFGLPVAMVILCIFALPLFYRLNVYTAYEYLEGRFDLRTRVLTAILFLIQRGLAAGITIFAPAIILSPILDWNLNLTILFIGLIVTFYTVFGGSKAVSVTQKQQMIIILIGMVVAAVVVVLKLPKEVHFTDAVSIAGKLGKLNVVDFKFDLSDRYNFWSGMLGGVFLFLSYFGTDQSQVQRYLSGRSLAESRLGLLFNGILKVPMQFLVLFVGTMVFVFYLYVKPPVHFNSANVKLVESEQAYQDLADQHARIFEARKAETQHLLSAIHRNDERGIEESKAKMQGLKLKKDTIESKVDNLILEKNPSAKVEDRDYVFLSFVMTALPIGIVGLLLAVIFSAAMSSTSSELNALATATVVDIYRRLYRPNETDHHYLQASKLLTVTWGAIALLFAASAQFFENLIQLVNIIGSLFYGPILGIFVVAFGLKKIGGRAVFWGAVCGEAVVLMVFLSNVLEFSDISFLWFNPIGCIAVVLFSLMFQQFRNRPAQA
ncbi:MAG TPA: sodium:solute symporter [Flavilitoribacter sp.]|nr:sodium:solute symporter [Flavilitoribacter sp.]